MEMIRLSELYKGFDETAELDGPPDEEMVELARRAVRSMEERKNENLEEWATGLVRSIFELEDDEEETKKKKKKQLTHIVGDFDPFMTGGGGSFGPAGAGA